MKKLLYHIGQYLTVRYCPHKNKSPLFEDWGERYVSYICKDCKKKIYEDL